MNFQDQGIIIASRPFKENFKLISLITQNHGLYSSIVRESSRKRSAIYNEGNLVDFLWQARLDEHLGYAKCELVKSYSGILITSKIKLYAFNSIISIIKVAFHEREPHNNLFTALNHYMQLELAILQEAGYGLRLKECAVTGQNHDLHYVSPKSGRALSFKAGSPYNDKLMILPQFLLNFQPPTIDEKNQAFNLTSYFFNRYIFQNTEQNAIREIFIKYALTLP